MAEACRAGGLKLGIYVSPWDRHEPSYGDSPRYNAHFRAQLRELLTGYGPLFSVWFDGACGEGPNGKRQVYDWESYYAMIRELQPDAAISICGPDVRWCGNEAGHSRVSEWNVVPAAARDPGKVGDGSQRAEGEPPIDAREVDLGSRERIAAARALIWYPAEVDTSIRPGWFYHPEADDKVRPLETLLDIYYGAVGGNATLLLNVPPDRRGRIHEADVARLRELGDGLRRTFATNLAADAEVTASATRAPEAWYAAAHMLDGDPDTFWMAPPGQERAEVLLALPASRRFNVAGLQEAITRGQRIEQVRLSIPDGDGWRTIAEATTVGHRRLMRFHAVAAQRVRIEILASRVCPTLAAVGLYDDGGG